MRLHTSHSLDYVESVQAGFDDLCRAHQVSGYVSPLGGPRPAAMRVPLMMLPLLVHDVVLRTIERATRRGVVIHEGKRPRPAKRERKPKLTSAERGARIKAGKAARKAHIAPPERTPEEQSAVQRYLAKRSQYEREQAEARQRLIERGWL